MTEPTITVEEQIAIVELLATSRITSGVSGRPPEHDISEIPFCVSGQMLYAILSTLRRVALLEAVAEEMRQLLALKLLIDAGYPRVHETLARSLTDLDAARKP